MNYFKKLKQLVIRYRGDVLGSPFLIVSTVSVDVKKH